MPLHGLEGLGGPQICPTECPPLVTPPIHDPQGVPSPQSSLAGHGGDVGGLGALRDPLWGAGTLRVTPGAMQGRLLAVKQPGGGHREGTQGGDTAGSPQGLGALRLSRSRIQIRPHWKKPRKRCLILPKTPLILDFQVRPNWEDKEQCQTLGGMRRGPRGQPEGTRSHSGPFVPRPEPSRRRAPPWAAAAPGKRSPGTRSPPVGTQRGHGRARPRRASVSPPD